MSERTPPFELRGVASTASAAETTVRRVVVAVDDLVAAVPRIESAVRSGVPGMDSLAAAITELSAGVMDACVAFTGLAISSSLST